MTPGDAQSLQWPALAAAHACSSLMHGRWKDESTGRLCARAALPPTPPANTVVDYSSPPLLVSAEAAAGVGRSGRRVGGEGLGEEKEVDVPWPALFCCFCSSSSDSKTTPPPPGSKLHHLSLAQGSARALGAEPGFQSPGGSRLQFPPILSHAPTAHPRNLHLPMHRPRPLPPRLWMMIIITLCRPRIRGSAACAFLGGCLDDETKTLLLVHVMSPVWGNTARGSEGCGLGGLWHSLCEPC